jgi:hypothetical protein
MDIKKLSGEVFNSTIVPERKNSQPVVSQGTNQSRSGEDAVSASVVSDFETTQRAKVASLASAVRDGSYKQPSGQQLASSFVAGIEEVIGMVGGAGSSE